jgi:hypothetical protein
VIGGSPRWMIEIFQKFVKNFFFIFLDVFVFDVFGSREMVNLSSGFHSQGLLQIKRILDISKNQRRIYLITSKSMM